MKVSKFLILTVSVTMFSLLYVFQQSEIFRLAYVGQKKSVLFQELLDKNSVLRYNIRKYASLVEVGSRVSKDSDFQMPDTYRLVRLVPSRSGIRLKEIAQNQQAAKSGVFGVRLQAEAKTISP